MPGWEYVRASCLGHNKPLGQAENMLVNSSDGRFSNEKLPNSPHSILQAYGDDGWELVEIEKDPQNYFIAFWLKRPK